VQLVQFLNDVAPITVLYVPARQPVQVLEPAAPNVPAWQSVQALIDVALADVLNLPARHSVQTLAPAALYLPARQSGHALEPAMLCVPAGHDNKQVSAPSAL
jgi:hypothetical protein